MDFTSTIYPRDAICIDADRIAPVIADPTHIPDSFAAVPTIDTGEVYRPDAPALYCHRSRLHESEANITGLTDPPTSFHLGLVTAEKTLGKKRPRVHIAANVIPRSLRSLRSGWFA
jgi:hypothetical protein